MPSTTRQVELLRRICDTIVLALDTDLAGDAAARRGIEIAETAGLVVKVAVWTSGKDPADVAMNNVDEWKKIVEAAVPIYDFYIQSAVARHGLDVTGKKRIGQELAPLVAKIDDEIIKTHYIKKLAATLEVNEEDIRAQMDKVPSSQNKQPAEPAPKPTSTRQELLESYVVGLAAREGKIADLAKVADLIRTPFWKKVLSHLQDDPDVAHLPAELKGKIQDMYLSDIEFDPREWDKSIKRLEETTIREDLTQMVKDGDPKQVRKLSARLGELTREN